MTWPWSAEPGKESWPKNKPFPSGADGIVHTHPTKVPNNSPKPSQTDHGTANKVNMPVYAVSDDGIWKATPNCKNPTKVANSDWQKDCKK